LHVCELFGVSKRDEFALDFEDILAFCCADCKVIATNLALRIDEFLGSILPDKHTRIGRRPSLSKRARPHEGSRISQGAEGQVEGGKVPMLGLSPFCNIAVQFVSTVKYAEQRDRSTSVTE
jgi:hypothetical protein